MHLYLSCNVCRSCGAMDNELQQLTQQKDGCLAELEKLKREEGSYRSELSDLKDQIKEKQDNELAKKAQITNAKNLSSSARKNRAVKAGLKEPHGSEERNGVHLSNGFAHVGQDEAKKLTEDENTDETKSEEEEVDMTAGTMNLTELGQPASKHKVCVFTSTLTLTTSSCTCTETCIIRKCTPVFHHQYSKFVIFLVFLFQVTNNFLSTQSCPTDSEDSSALLNNLQTRLTEKSKELHQTLLVEQDSLVKTKAYLKKQQETLKQRKLALKLARKDWRSGLKSTSKTKGSLMVRTIYICMLLAMSIITSTIY